MRAERIKMRILAPKKLYGGQTKNRSEIPHYAYTWPVIHEIKVTETREYVAQNN